VLCKKPFMVGAVPFGCGRCLPCRVNRRTLWMWRLVLESYLHEHSTFVTLTYSDENLPEGGNLVPRDATLWLKRLREKIAPRKIRYFLVGEYGDETWRPHYHAMLFGVSEFENQAIEKTWGKGHVMCGEMNEKSAAYISKYCVKGLTMECDSRLASRQLTPEFARMSRRPGIAADAMAIVADALHCRGGLDYLEKNKDVPYKLAMGKKTIIMGRYLRSRLRKEMGVPPEWMEYAKRKGMEHASEEMFTVWANALADEVPLSFSTALVEKWQGKIWSAEARQKINSSRKGKSL